MSDGVITPDNSLMNMNIGIGVTSASPESSYVNGFEDFSVSQTLFPDATSFVPRMLDQPSILEEKEVQVSANIGSMSTADMFKVISDLEQPKRPLPGTRYYGSDAAMKVPC
jgi:hypothetical protein